MAQIAQFIRPADALDPEVLSLLGEAYEIAVASLQDIGQPQVIREVLAKRIIRAAQEGERDRRLFAQSRWPLSIQTSWYAEALGPIDAVSVRRRRHPRAVAAFTTSMPKPPRY